MRLLQLLTWVIFALLASGGALPALGQWNPGQGRPRTERPTSPVDSLEASPTTTRTRPAAGALKRYTPGSAPSVAPLSDEERQAVDSAMTSFGEKQTELVRLLERQLPRLRELDAQLTAYEATLRTVDSVYAYPANAGPYRDSVMNAIVRIRRFYERGNRQVRDFHYAWLPHTLDLMAVYTRYGELSVLRRDDAGLRRFLKLYREHYALLDNLSVRMRDLYNLTEYLLNAKLK